MELPKKWNLFDFTEQPIFENWEQGIEAFNNYENVKKETAESQTLFNWIKRGCIVAGIFMLGSLFFFAIILFIIAYILRKNGKQAIKLNQKVNQAHDAFMNVWWNHTDIFIHSLADKLMNNEQWNSFRTGKKGILYSNNTFIYYEADTGLLVAYDKKNIKEVSRERLHVGANTTGNSGTTGVGYTFKDTGVTIGGAQTSSHSNTQNIYEWHFDVMTDFITYPKVSLVLNDTPNVEDFIGKAYAILKP